jgi:hypothetical protein
VGSLVHTHAVYQHAFAEISSLGEQFYRLKVLLSPLRTRTPCTSMRSRRSPHWASSSTASRYCFHRSAQLIIRHSPLSERRASTAHILQWR